MTELSPEMEGTARGFHSVMEGRFMARHGAGYSRDIPYCNKKLCFSATDLPFLAELLAELAEDPDCYFVKFSTGTRDGIHLGRCFFLEEGRVGETWARYKMHPKLLCSVQDDDFTTNYREKVAPWSDEDVRA
ncbi:MAG: hypothetical protein VX498_10695 [Myxococcota bacterium]|nr:hypothetical protein [Myxococcota bacterium]